ncbi:hypothetical protein TKK_0000109 [Trichogramma kaykai]
MRAMQLLVEAYGLQRIGIVTPSHTLPTNAVPQFADIKLADPEPYNVRPIEVILWADIYNQLVLPGIIQRDGNVAPCTIFGWILTGSISYQGPALTLAAVHCTTTTLELPNTVY